MKETYTRDEVRALLKDLKRRVEKHDAELSRIREHDPDIANRLSLSSEKVGMSRVWNWISEIELTV